MQYNNKGTVEIQKNQNSEYQYDCLIKLLMVGNSHVGKSCMLLRYTENLFTNNFYNTIGVDFKTKITQVDGKVVKLQIWDTAGQDRFRTITNNYYRGAHGVLVVFDVTDRISFENIQQWMDDINKYSIDKLEKILVGNKTDMSEKRKVSSREGQNLANKYGIPYMESSAKNADNIETVFQAITQLILRIKGSQIIVKSNSEISTGSIQNNSTQNINGRQLQQFQYRDKQIRGGCC